MKGPSAGAPAEITAYNATMAYKQTEHLEEAKAFLKWYSENNLDLWTEYGTGSIPPRISQMNDPKLLATKTILTWRISSRHTGIML